MIERARLREIQARHRRFVHESSLADLFHCASVYHTWYLHFRHTVIAAADRNIFVIDQSITISVILIDRLRRDCGRKHTRSHHYG